MKAVPGDSTKLTMPASVTGIFSRACSAVSERTESAVVSWAGADPDPQRRRGITSNRMERRDARQRIHRHDGGDGECCEVGCTQIPPGEATQAHFFTVASDAVRPDVRSAPTCPCCRRHARPSLPSDRASRRRDSSSEPHSSTIRRPGVRVPPPLPARMTGSLL